MRKQVSLSGCIFQHAYVGKNSDLEYWKRVILIFFTIRSKRCIVLGDISFDISNCKKKPSLEGRITTSGLYVFRALYPMLHPQLSLIFLILSWILEGQTSRDSNEPTIAGHGSPDASTIFFSLFCFLFLHWSLVMYRCLCVFRGVAFSESYVWEIEFIFVGPSPCMFDGSPHLKILSTIWNQMTKSRKMFAKIFYESRTKKNSSHI